MWIKKFISSLSRYNNDEWRIRAISKYCQVQRYLNLCFLLCLSLLRPFNLIRSEIVWQICYSLLLLTVPMGLIFFLVPCPFPISLWSEEKYRSHDMKIEVACNETFVLEGVFAASTPGCCPCVQRTDPDQEDEEESHSSSFPRDSSVPAVLQLGSV